MTNTIFSELKSFFQDKKSVCPETFNQFLNGIELYGKSDNPSKITETQIQAGIDEIIGWLYTNIKQKDSLLKELAILETNFYKIVPSEGCVCKDEDEKLYFCNCTEVRSEERWVLYPATKRQIEQIVSKSKTPAEVFQDSRVVYMYTIGLDTGRGTLRELTVDELSDADKLPEGAYV